MLLMLRSEYKQRIPVQINSLSKENRMSSITPPEQHIVISALAEAPLQLTNLLCRACQESRCATISSRLTQHGQLSALTLQVKGSWDALARLEATLQNLKKRDGLALSWERSTQEHSKPQALPYMVYVSALYRPDILGELCQFFTDHGIGLDSIQYDSYQAPQTNTTMLNATFTVSLPTQTQISWLRDQFLDFADALNLDALIEPWRPQPF